MNYKSSYNDSLFVAYKQIYMRKNGSLNMNEARATVSRDEGIYTVAPRT